MSGTSGLYNLSIGYILSDPDNNPDKVSGYRVIKRLQWRVPTIIPTKCRDSGAHLFKNSLLRQESHHFGEICVSCRPSQEYRIMQRNIMSGYRYSGAQGRIIRTGIRTLFPDRGEADQI